MLYITDAFDYLASIRVVSEFVSSPCEKEGNRLLMEYFIAVLKQFIGIYPNEGPKNKNTHTFSR